MGGSNRRVPGILCFMESRPSLRRVTALLVAVTLGLGIVPVHGAEGVHSGCSRDRGDTASHHPAATAHAGHEQTPAQPLLLGFEKAQDACDHCPPEQCAVSAPCAGTSFALMTASRSHCPAVPAAAPKGAAWLPTHSMTPHPPTPPPNTLL